MANTQVITDAPVRSILISLAHSLSLLLFSRGNRTLYRGEEKWRKKERGRSVWAEQCSTRRWCENARERAKRTRANERGKRSVQHYRVRFSVVFNALSLAAPPPSTRPSPPSPPPSLPIAPSENCHVARALSDL